MTPRARMLVVDDVQEIFPLFEGAAAGCRSARLSVTTMDDSRAAARLLAETTFDLVVADYRMPHLDGLDLLAAGLRVLASGFREATLPARKVELARPHRFLQKPIARGELAIFLDRLLARSAPRLIS